MDSIDEIPPEGATVGRQILLSVFHPEPKWEPASACDRSVEVRPCRDVGSSESVR